jgi:hypothetical protein
MVCRAQKNWLFEILIASDSWKTELAFPTWNRQHNSRQKLQVVNTFVKSIFFSFNIWVGWKSKIWTRKFSLPRLFLTHQYFNFILEQKLQNVFTEIYAVQIHQKFRKIRFEVRIQGKKNLENAFQSLKPREKWKFE